MKKESFNKHTLKPGELMAKKLFDLLYDISKDGYDMSDGELLDIMISVMTDEEKYNVFKRVYATINAEDEI